MSILDRFDAMVKAGVPYDLALECARGFEADLEAAMLRGAQAVAGAMREDPKAEARKARDRERKREPKPGIPRNSADSTETLPQGSQGSFSPTPPKSPNPPNPNLVPPIVPQNAEKSARKARLGPAKGAFARFWAEYPLKVGKLAAERAYAVAWGRCESDDPESEILDGLRRCKPLMDPEFIPHPTSWLNAGRWTDQPNPEPTGRATGPPGSSAKPFDLAAFEAKRAAEQAQIEAALALEAAE